MNKQTIPRAPVEQNGPASELFNGLEGGWDGFEVDNYNIAVEWRGCSTGFTEEVGAEVEHKSAPVHRCNICRSQDGAADIDVELEDGANGRMTL